MFIYIYVYIYVYMCVCVFIFSLSYHWIGLRDVFLRETTIFHGNKIWFPVDVPLNQSNDMWDFHGIEPSTPTWEYHWILWG